MTTFSSRPSPSPYSAVSPTSPSSFSRTPSFHGPYSAHAHGTNTFSGTGPSSSSFNSNTRTSLRLPQIFKRLTAITQMDFEVAVWEMTHLMIAPKKVFRNVYYRKQTKNTYASTDPAFPYLLLFFQLLTSLAWSLAYADPSPANIVRIALTFTVVHCLLSGLVVATFMYVFVGRALGPGGWFAGIKRPGGFGRRRGLFGDVGNGGGGSGGAGGEEIEFGFCFDVAIRSFFPLWLYLYVIQFLLLPLVSSVRFPAALLSNTLHLLAFTHATYVTFCGYATLPSLVAPQLLLVPPLVGFVALWVLAIGVGGWNASLHLAPVLWAGAGLRGRVGGGS